MTKQQEALELSKQIINSLELNNSSLQDLLFKALRVCRLINDESGIKLFTFETCGYERDKEGNLTQKSWGSIDKIGRYFYRENQGERKRYAEVRLVGELSDEIKILNERMKVASDPQNYGANMTPHMITLAKNVNERSSITKQISHNNNFINTIKGFLYNYILNIYNALIYGEITQTVFDKMRETVDNQIATYCPENTKKFLSVYENLQSTNSEDWANAVHTCRRIIKELANNLYPAQKEEIEHKGKKIKIGDGQYINRLMLYIESRESSNTYKHIVGNSLEYIGNSIDSITEGLNKGTHDKYTKMDAERIVIYTYMLIGDILRL